MLSSNEQDIDDSLNGPFLLDNSDKNLESEENVIFMQYLTGDNMDAKISADSGSDVDESSDDETDDPTYRSYPGPPLPVEVPHMMPIPHPHHLEQQHHHQLQQQRLHQLQQQQAQVAQQQHHQRQHQHQQVQQQQQIQQVQQNGDSSNMVYHNPDENVITYTSKGRLKWTPAMDKLLREGVEKHSGHGVGMWKKVADHVSQGLGIGLMADGSRIISNHQCGERYKHHLDPALDARKSGPWTDEDVENLKRLVAENTSHDESGAKKKSVINWVKISIILNRHYRDCQHKWINMVKSELKTGVFSKEEEELLMRRVAEWGDRGKGIWVTLEKELGRRNRSILDKYRRMVKKKTS